MAILHFPTGKAYREVGDTKIIARDDTTADFLAGMFETFERLPGNILGNGGNVDDQQTADMLERLIRIERILRNGLPHDDKDVAGTIAHAHVVTEQALEAIDPDWWMR